MRCRVRSHLSVEDLHQHLRMLSDFPSWSVTGRRGRKAKEPSVSTKGSEHVRNSNAAESKDSNSSTILSNVTRDKGKGIIVTDENLEAMEVRNETGRVLGSNNKNNILPHQMNLDLRIGDATESNVLAWKAYICKFCSKSFSKYEALGGHTKYHDKRKSKGAKDEPAKRSRICSATARGVGEKEANKVHECNVCHRVFKTGLQLGSHKRAHYHGTLSFSSSKRAKCSARGSSSSRTAVYAAHIVPSSESILHRAAVAASSSEAEETSTSAAATASGRVVLDIDLNEIPPDEEQYSITQ